VRDEENVLVVTGVDGSEVVVSGRGAGRRPTALAVMADLEGLRRQRVLQARPTGGRLAEGVA